MVEILLKRMDDLRDWLVVIAAGYTREMQEFVAFNPGLESRFTKYIDFPDYSADEKLQFNAFGFERTATNAQTYLDWDVKSGVSPFRMRRDQDVQCQAI